MILLYHKVALESPSEWWVTVNQFYRQMLDLQSKSIVYLNEYDPNNTNHVVITFDGVYQNVLQYAAPILKHFNYPFELFITGSYLGKTNDFDIKEPHSVFANLEELKELELHGGRIQWHTQTHPDLQQIVDSKLIEKELDVPNRLRIFNESSYQWFAYPYGKFNSTVIETTKLKFKGALSCNQGSDCNPFALNRLTVTNNTKLNSRTVCCIIPCYNYGSYLSEAIESVLRQTFTPDKILIADDHSTDISQEIAEYYQKKYPDLITYHRNSKNLGIVDNFNTAIGLTSETYIVFLGADNSFQSNYIEECVKILDSDPQIAIAYTDFLLFGTRAKSIYNDFKPNFQSGEQNGFYKIRFPEDSEVNIIETIKDENFIHGSSMFKREAYDLVGGYQKKEDIPEDYDLFMRIIKKGYRTQKAKRTYLQYRQHSEEQANIKLGVQLTLNLYRIRNKELEDELNFLKQSKVIRLVSLIHSTKRKAIKLLSYYNKNGLKATLKRLK